MLGTFQNWMVILERTLRAKGIDLKEGLLRQGLNLADATRMQRLPVAVTRQIWAGAEMLSQDPVLGITMLEHMDFTDFGDMGVFMVAGGSLSQMMARIARFHALLTDALHYEITETRNRLSLVMHTRGDPHWRAVEMTTGMIVRLLRARLDPNLRPLSLSFAFDNPAGQATYDRYFGCAVTLGAHETRLTFDLDACPVAPGGELGEQIDRILSEKLSKLEKTASWTEKTSRIIRATLSEGEPTLAEVGEVLHISTRTLQRHLSGESRTFQEVLDDTRQTVAREWLANNGRKDKPRPLTELALLLGFSSSSAFSRAFRRWFDKTPGQAARELHLP
jgi:AraC-like DNA-binding protein